MLLNQVPSAQMLHSVGALMDTSFLRDAVADADGAARPSTTRPGSPRPWHWLQAFAARLGKSRR